MQTRWKTYIIKSRLVQVLPLITWESVTKVKQSRTKAEANRTFDTFSENRSIKINTNQHCFWFEFSVELDKNFPHEAPFFYLQSIYHEKNNQPYEKLEADYPYSPRWSGDEMAERARYSLLFFIL